MHQLVAGGGEVFAQNPAFHQQHGSRFSETREGHKRLGIGADARIGGHDLGAHVDELLVVADVIRVMLGIEDDLDRLRADRLDLLLGGPARPQAVAVLPFSPALCKTGCT